MQDKLFSRSEGSTLNSLRRRIDRFCVLHPNFGIPNLMLYIVIGNIAFYLLSLFSTLDGGSFYSILSFSWAGLKQGQLWRLLSFSFLPTDTRPFWLLVSCYFYYWIGSTLEREWGTAKFTIYYLSGVLLTALGAVITSLITGYDWQVAGATYVNFCHVLRLRHALSRRAGAAVLLHSGQDQVDGHSGCVLLRVYHLLLRRLPLLDRRGAAARGAAELLCVLRAGAGALLPSGSRRGPSRRRTSTTPSARRSASSRVRATATSARSAAAPTSRIRSCSSATAPSARAITASAPTIFSTTSTSRTRIPEEALLWH